MGLKEDRVRQGELARAFTLDHLRKTGLKVNSDLDRELGQLANNMNAINPLLKTSKNELLELYSIFADETVTRFRQRIASITQDVRR